MKCVQTLNLMEDLRHYTPVKFNVQSILPVWKHHKLIFAGSAFMGYEYDKNTYPHQIDEYVPVGTYFHPPS